MKKQFQWRPLNKDEVAAEMIQAFYSGEDRMSSAIEKALRVKDSDFIDILHTEFLYYKKDTTLNKLLPNAIEVSAPPERYYAKKTIEEYIGAAIFQRIKSSKLDASKLDDIEIYGKTLSLKAVKQSLDVHKTEETLMPSLMNDCNKNNNIVNGVYTAMQRQSKPRACGGGSSFNATAFAVCKTARTVEKRPHDADDQEGQRKNIKTEAAAASR